MCFRTLPALRTQRSVYMSCSCGSETPIIFSHSDNPAEIVSLLCCTTTEPGRDAVGQQTLYCPSFIDCSSARAYSMHTPVCQRSPCRAESLLAFSSVTVSFQMNLLSFSCECHYHALDCVFGILSMNCSLGLPGNTRLRH